MKNKPSIRISVIIVILLIAAFLVVVFGGLYNVAATNGHLASVEWIF